jgi:hypothetical protein
MPILAVCPYCHEGKVRAPDSAVGLSADCPRCHNCFTLVASTGRLQEPARPSRIPPPRPPAIAVKVPPPTDETIATEELTVPLDSPAPAPAPVPTTSDLTRIITEAPARPPEPALAPALVAVSLGGVALLLSQVPHGRFGTVALAALGLLVGLGCLGFAQRSRLVAVGAAVLNTAVLLVIITLPGWLGLEPWWPRALPDDSRTVKAIALGDTGSRPAEWVDISTASWQLGDVRVSVPAVRFEQLELTGPNNRKKRTKEDLLQVWVRVKNVGVTRKVDFRGWSAAPSPGAPAPRLTDSARKVLAAKLFDPGWEAPGRPQTGALFPGRSTLQLLVFEAPSPSVDPFRLELPGAAFGTTETVRLLIPRSTVNTRPAP